MKYTIYIPDIWDDVSLNKMHCENKLYPSLDLYWAILGNLIWSSGPSGCFASMVSI
jgi:hypothetical protein